MDDLNIDMNNDKIKWYCNPDPEWAPWQSWSACAKTCGSSIPKQRRRNCQINSFIQAAYKCDGDFEERSTCPTEPCPIPSNKQEKYNIFHGLKPVAEWLACETSMQGGRGSNPGLGGWIFQMHQKAATPSLSHTGGKLLAIPAVAPLGLALGGRAIAMNLKR